MKGDRIQANILSVKMIANISVEMAKKFKLPAAGAHIADIIKEILEKKASGLDLKLEEEGNEGR